MKYKILFVNLFPEIGGAETSLIYLIKGLNKRRLEPIVILPRRGYFSERLKKETNARLVFLNLPGFLVRQLFIPGANPVAAYKFYKLCKEIKPDLIHLTHIYQAFYAGVVRKLLRIPVVTVSWMQSDSIYFYQDLVTNLSVDKVLAVSPELKKRIVRKRIVHRDKVQVVRPGLDAKFFSPTPNKMTAKRKLGIKEENLVLTNASRFDPVKDHLTFLRATRIVADKVPNLTVLLVQDPKLNLEDENAFAPQVKNEIDNYLAKNPKLKNVVTFTGYRQDMRPIYHATDILVSSSLYESLGMIHMEAASCGIPIVSTNYEGQYAIVKNGKTGFLVPVKKPKLMAEKVLGLAKDKKLREKFGKAARAHIVRNFTIQKYAKKVEKVYLSLL